jgi:hypothetical protein
MEVYMDDLQKLRIRGFSDKVACLFGLHHYVIENEYPTTDKYSSKRGVQFHCKEICHVCGRSHDVTESYSKWEGRQRHIIKIWYVGDYYWGSLVREAVVKLNAMFGGIL